MTDTSGFYKVDNGSLLYGPNFVLNAEYELYKDTHLDMAEPVDGWMFYPDEESARIAFGL